MVIAEIEEILLKYKPQEEKINRILEKISAEKNEMSLANRADAEAPKLLTLEEAKERNKNILKELELTKANLRSKSIFSPIELQWEKICEQYRNNPSLPVTTWRCHLPVFV